jgi:transposase-like protein
MAEFPETVREFRAWFPDDAACRAYLERVRWAAGPRCPRCPDAKVWTSQPPFYRCSGCGYDFTVTVGRLFADTHLPLSLWFEAIWFVVNQKNGASALGVKNVLGISYPTAWRWMHKLRRAMVRPGRDRLAGAVEVDEVYIGGERSGKRGRGAAGKALVLVVAQADGPRIGRIRLGRVANASAAALTGHRCLRGARQPGFDRRLGRLWRLGSERLRSQSRAQDGGGGRESPAKGQPGCESAPAMAAWHTSVAHSHLDYYLDEFTFRFNRRRSRSRGLLFYRLIEQALATGPVRGRDLVGGTSPQQIVVGESS